MNLAHLIQHIFNLNLQYAHCQLKIHRDKTRHCNFNFISSASTGTYKIKTGFKGFTDMPAEFQKAMDYTLVGLRKTYFFSAIFYL